MPLLEIVTRCYKRPQMLSHNRASLQRQTWGDWTQTLLHDDEGRGIAFAYKRLAAYAPIGQYVWILDDDDLCVSTSLVAELFAIDKGHTPDVVMMKMDHGDGGILPDKDTWQKPPVLGYVGVSAYIVNRSTWLRHRHAFADGGGRYQSDFDFINAVFAADPDVYWLDMVASRVQKISRGEPETA